MATPRPMNICGYPYNGDSRKEDAARKEAIVEQIQVDPEMMTVLAIIRDLNLADAWLAAGAVRNFIWNQLSGKPGFDATTDLDLVFYDPTISYEGDSSRSSRNQRRPIPSTLGK